MSKYKVHENRNTVHFKRESYVQNKFATYVAHASLLKMSKYKNLKKPVKTVTQKSIKDRVMHFNKWTSEQTNYLWLWREGYVPISLMAVEDSSSDASDPCREWFGRVQRETVLNE